MSRLKQTFDNLKHQNKKAFSLFLMSGYPDDETFLETLEMSAETGVDFIEVGMPFSDPSADGPVIKAAGGHSLKNGTTVSKTIELISRFRQTNDKTPIIWMGYFNPVFKYGIDRFFDDADNAGVDGLLLVDLPPNEYERIQTVKNHNIDVIRLVTPVTSKERIPLILENSGGFIYFVSITGITGTKEAQDEAIKNKVWDLKTVTNLPVIVGFGIKNAQKARQINEFADGVIVGSAAISIITKYI
ncbi:MAG: tryptophan synthase subunit alpha, partial [Candidatus Gastranaerophilales bacterium]|nr:tryptophan synthase subunit alpha [Candidatus Gastranaerophilales bacterium]